MAISPSGDLVPCQSYLNGLSFGNLLTKSFNSIWDSKELVNFRNKTIKLDNKCPLNMEEIKYEKNNF